MLPTFAGKGKNYTGGRVPADLRELFHAGYISRLTREHERGSVPGSSKILYQLGYRGEAYLRRHKILSPTRQPKLLRHIQHAMMVSHWLTALQLDCQRSGRYQIIWPDQLIPEFPGKTAEKLRPMIWRLKTVNRNGESVVVSLEPDFPIAILDTHENKRLYLLLEADSGAATIMERRHYREGLHPNERANSIYKKIIGYFDGWQAGLHTRLWGWKNLRIYHLSTTRTGGVDKAHSRIVNKIIPAAKFHTLCKAPNLFHFANFPKLVREELVETSYIGRDGKERTKRAVVTTYGNPLTELGLNVKAQPVSLIGGVA